jgi:hypothetical protein
VRLGKLSKAESCAFATENKMIEGPSHPFNWRKIAIAPIDLGFAEEKAESCENA